MAWKEISRKGGRRPMIENYAVYCALKVARVLVHLFAAAAKLLIKACMLAIGGIAGLARGHVGVQGDGEPK